MLDLEKESKIESEGQDLLNVEFTDDEGKTNYQDTNVELNSLDGFEKELK